MSRLPDIVCRGAREHNLRDLDVRIPGGSLVAFTGVSGSGKSSLAFDVIAREGRRRYLQTLSALARRRVGAERPPAVDAVEGLTATIALEQADPGRSPRSTVGTASGVAGYLRSLWTFAGVVHCAQCDSPVSEGSIAQVVPSILDWAADRRTILLAPIWKGRRGNLAEQLRDLQERGFVRVRLDGEVKRLDEVKFPAGRHQRHDLDVVVDRLRVDGSKASRVREAVERGTALSEGLVTVMLEDGTERTFGTERVCLSCGVAWPRPVPAWFSFNDSLGACERCRGTGEIEEAPCPDCDGERLRPLSRQVRFEGLRLPEAQRLPLDQLTRWIEEHMDPEDPDRHELLRGAHERLRCLLDLALGYVSLERRTGTLSRGELQRVRLAAVLGAGLHGVTYVLDEPAVGLHAVDRLRLSRHLRGLRDRGNNVLFVEHDLDLIRAADHVIDLGPGAGAAGGRLLVQGTPSEVAAESASPTGRALSEGPLRVEPIASDEDPPAPVLRIVGAREHNLKDIDVAIPLGRLVALTGVSGSGKSTLTESILYPALASRLQKAKLPAGEHERLEGAAELVRVEHVTARSLGRSPRSCPATIVKAFDEIRALFALLPEARARGWTARRFSLNVAGGRCEACKGTGFRSVRLEPLPPVEVTCSNCDGRRYERSMLDLRFKGKTIAEVLDLSVDEARELFLNQPKIHRALQALSKVGLGYLRLGQPLPRLSGGEAQRLKLAAEMRRRRQGKTLFILDEPTRGLHAFDIERLLACWRELVDRGDTVLVVEHHLSVVARADWVIDLGPGPGEAGGQIVACGPPAAIAASEASVTGAALRGELSPEAAERRGHEDPAEEPVRIECARARNLKSLSLEIPNGKIIQVKGPLGSGKTALVSETIAAEARRVFLSALASGGWGGLEGATRPDVRSVSGLRPVLVLEEPGSAGRARGTVATACGLDRPLRELFARCGVLHCPECGLVARGESPDQAASRMLEEHTGRADVLAPLWWPQSGRTTAITDPARVEDALEWCRQNGLTRIVANDDVLRIDRDDIPSPLPDETFLLLDRLELTEAKRGRLREAIETAFDLASGLAIVVTQGRRSFIARDPGCPEHAFWPPTPIDARWLSFQDAAGRCGTCHGRGELLGGEQCPTCEGSRLGPLARGLRVGERRLEDWYRLDASGVHRALEGAAGKHEDVAASAGPLRESLDRLIRLGLDGLPLDRAARSLSDGEWQQLRLADRLPTDLAGSLVIADRVLAGLDPGSVQRSLDELARLSDRGNSVVLVDESEPAAERADAAIELGPGSGIDGGRVVTAPAIHHSRKSRAKPRRVERHLRVEGLRLPTGDELSVELKKERLVVVAGPKGAGKSTLLDFLCEEVRRRLGDEAPGGTFCELVGARTLQHLGRLPRFLPSPQESVSWYEWAGLRGALWALFAATPRARLQGDFQKLRTGATAPELCPECRGRGRVAVRLPLLPGAERTCPRCRGRRFRDSALGITVRGMTILDVLAQSAIDARDVLAHDTDVVGRLQLLEDLGVGHVPLERLATEASSGEVRLGYLARMLHETGSPGALLALEWPALGLDRAGGERVAAVLTRRASKGDTVLCIDTHPALNEAADAVIRLG